MIRADDIQTLNRVDISTLNNAVMTHVIESHQTMIDRRSKLRLWRKRA